MAVAGIIWRFFFSSRRRHTRFDCDWSSDVCSSDLAGGDGGLRPPHGAGDRADEAVAAGGGAVDALLQARPRQGEEADGGRRRGQRLQDRESGVEGKRVDLGGRRIIKKKKEQ